MTTISSSLSPIVFPILGYLSGSLSFAIWVTWLFKRVDVRDAGSKHATTTNTIRQAGWLPGVLVLILDIGKGFLPVYLAQLSNTSNWVIGLTAAAAVAGHCWPLFAKFHGGMGLATTGGAVLSASPIAFGISLALLIFLVLIIKHGARASVITGLLLAPMFWLLGQTGPEIWIAGFSGLVIAGRFTIDWKREYRELWLDREKS